jgi:hypothetical protein
MIITNRIRRDDIRLRVFFEPSQSRYPSLSLENSCKNVVVVGTQDHLRLAQLSVAKLLSCAPAASRTFWNAHARLSRLVPQNRAYLAKTGKLRSFFCLARNDFKPASSLYGKLVKVVYDVFVNNFEITTRA